MHVTENDIGKVGGVIGAVSLIWKGLTYLPRKFRDNTANQVLLSIETRKLLDETSLDLIRSLREDHQSMRSELRELSDRLDMEIEKRKAAEVNVEVATVDKERAIKALRLVELEQTSATKRIAELRQLASDSAAENVVLSGKIKSWTERVSVLEDRVVVLSEYIKSQGLDIP